MEAKMAPSLALAAKRSPGSAEHFGIFMVTLCSSVVVFFLGAVLYNFGIFFHKNAVVTITALSLVACLMLIATRKSSAYFLPLGLVGVATVVCATVMGLFCYDAYGYFCYLYSNTRTYHNVVASENAAAVADAGRLIFASEAHVDVTNAVGYAAQDGNRYCVAPIRDMVEARTVEFWAVGYNCCGWMGQFDCDEAGAPSAHGGIVVLESLNLLGIISSNREQYDHARKKAEALYDLIPAIKPVYVRWVNEQNLDMLISYYYEKSWIFIVLATIFYTFLAGPSVFVLCRMVVPPLDAAAAASLPAV
jgi:hypothetical protein